MIQDRKNMIDYLEEQVKGLQRDYDLLLAEYQELLNGKLKEYQFGENMSIKNTLTERQKTHGEFETHAAISQRLKQVITDHVVSRLSHDQKEALDMIAHKIARILNGDPNHHDHWHDIAEIGRAHV